MRVLHVIASLHPETGGPARSVPALCAALHEEGADVTLVTHHVPGASMTVDQPPYRLVTLPPREGTRQEPTDEWRRKLQALVGEHDVVHINALWNRAVTLGAHVAADKGTPYVISPRGVLQRRAMRNRWPLKLAYWALWERRSLSHAHAIQFFNEGEAGDSVLVPSGARVTLIPNGISPGLRAPSPPGAFRAKHGLADRPVALFAGRLHWTKGLLLQARAIALAASRLPDLAWVVAGPDAGYGPTLQREIRRLGIGSRTFLVGDLARGDVLDAMADADAFLLTSHHEAHSVAMNEALALGVPTILTDSVRFGAVEEYGAGSVVPARPDALADALVRVVRSPSEAAKMREGAKRLVDERLKWPRVARATLDLYRSLRRD